MRDAVAFLQNKAEDERNAGNDELERLQAWQTEGRAWLAQCLGYVTGESPPSWDGIRGFLKLDANG